MKNNLELARELIQKKKQAEQAVKASEKELIQKEKEAERQRDRAERGLKNELELQQRIIAKAELALKKANEELSEVEQEIETQKLAADLNGTKEVKNEKKFYTDYDFSLIIDELLKKEMFEVTDFLEFHFSQIFTVNNMSKFNWLTSLRKNLMRRYTPPENITKIGYTVKKSSKTPSQINFAYLWERNKNIQLVAEANERADFNIKKNVYAKDRPKFSLSQIALIYCYEGKAITRKNSNKIAKEYGHNSGEKLFQKFTFFSSSQNRKGKPTPPTPKKFQNKIALFESVIENLSNQAKSRATDELELLKILFNNLDQ